MLTIAPSPEPTPSEPKTPPSFPRWTAFVDQGLHDFLWSGVVLVFLLLKIAALTVVTPFAWLGVGMRRAVEELHPRDKETL